MKYIILAIILMITVGCSRENKEEKIEEKPKSIIMNSKEQKAFEDKFFNLKYNLSVDEVKEKLALSTTSQSNVYRPAFRKKDSKKVGAVLLYEINDKRYRFVFSYRTGNSKLFGKTIEEIPADKILWKEYYKDVDTSKPPERQ